MGLTIKEIVKAHVWVHLNELGPWAGLLSAGITFRGYLRGVLPFFIPGSDSNDKADKHLFICNCKERLYVARTR